MSVAEIGFHSLVIVVGLLIDNIAKDKNLDL
jgi:hypothetical protein